MIVGEATTTVSVPPSEVFEFVLDLNRYRQADHKIGRVGVTERTGDSGTTRFSGRIRGLPGPSGTYPFTLTPTRLDFGSPIAEPLLRGWLESDTAEEMVRFKELVGQRPSPS